LLTADETRVFSASGDKTIKVWDVEDIVAKRYATMFINRREEEDAIKKGIKLFEKKPISLEGHQGHVWGIALTSNKNVLVSVSEDKTIRFWSLKGTT